MAFMEINCLASWGRRLGRGGNMSVGVGAGGDWGGGRVQDRTVSGCGRREQPAYCTRYLTLFLLTLFVLFAAHPVSRTWASRAEPAASTVMTPRTRWVPYPRLLVGAIVGHVSRQTGDRLLHSGQRCMVCDRYPSMYVSWVHAWDTRQLLLGL